LLALGVAAVVLMRTVRFGGPAAPSRAPGKKWRRIAAEYAAAVTVVAVAAVVQWRLVESFGPLPLFLVFYPAVLLVASIGGGGPGILATVLSALAADYWFVKPYGSFHVEATNDVLALGVFIGTNLCLCILAERLRRSRWAEAVSAAQEQQLEELTRLNEELSQQSEELSQQTEELAQQNEELQSQSEEIQTLSEEQQTIFDSVPAMIWYKDTKNNFVRVNRAVALSVGKPLEAIEGKSAYEIFPDEAERYYQDDLEVINSGQPKLGILEEMGTAGGEKRWVQTDKIPYRADGGDITGVLLLTVDITERKRAEEALRQSYELLQAIIDNTPALIYVKDLEGHITVANRPLGEAIGMDAHGIVGKTSREFVSNPKDAEIHMENDRRVIETGQAITVEESSLGHVFLSVKFPLRDARGRIFATGGVSTDITERKRAEEALRQTAEELTRSNKDLAQFAAVASHDLQEPLRTVTGFVQLLQQKYRNQLDAEADSFIEYAVDGTKRMETLIRDLLAYSRVGTRGMELAPTDATRALRQALDNLRGSIQETGAEITNCELPTVRADASQLTQLFQNLLGNALKFRSEAPPKIHVDARREGNDWRFSVSDNGIGIDPQFQDHIFEVFRRLHTQRKYAGTGIGLAICKKIVDRHGGRIWVESEPAHGATFHFTLPI
jgi:PAS domain S-box-containing protein